MSTLYRAAIAVSSLSLFTLQFLENEYLYKGHSKENSKNRNNWQGCNSCVILVLVHITILRKWITCEGSRDGMEMSLQVGVESWISLQETYLDISSNVSSSGKDNKFGLPAHTMRFMKCSSLYTYCRPIQLKIGSGAGSSLGIPYISTDGRADSTLASPEQLWKCTRAIHPCGSPFTWSSGRASHF